MQIVEAASLEDVMATSASEDLVMFSERNGAGFLTISASQKMTVLVGPKGGWDDAELQHALVRGVAVVTLGGRILRVETAAIAITSILQHRFGDLN